MGKSMQAARANARIARLRSDRNVAGLILELANPVEAGRYRIIRGRAAHALGDIGDPRAFPHLVGLVHDPHEVVRMHAFDALGRLGMKEAITILVEGLRDPSPLARSAAAEGLSRLRAEEGKQPLLDVFRRDEDDDVRFYAAQALQVFAKSDELAAEISNHLDRLPWWSRFRRKRWEDLLRGMQAA